MWILRGEFLYKADFFKNKETQRTMDKELSAFHKEYHADNDTLGISQGERGLFTSRWEPYASAKKLL